MDKTQISKGSSNRIDIQNRNGSNSYEANSSAENLEEAEDKVIDLVKIAIETVDSIKVMNGYILQSVVLPDNNNSIITDNDVQSNAALKDPLGGSMDIEKDKSNENENRLNEMKITIDENKKASDNVIKLSKEFSEKIHQLKSSLVEEVNHQSKSIGSSSKTGTFSYQLSSYSSKIQASVAAADLKRLKNDLQNALKE